ncbi:MAG: glycosyltransferase family 9 protein [Ignavibacteria bacterium]|nr:glycosyltransferase family 9 protein [Ignavibacteria bacterium]
MNNEQVRRILIIRLSSMGDIILTTPFVDLAAKTFPLARIDFCTKEKFTSLLRPNQNIHKVIKAKNFLNYEALKDLRQLIKMSNYNLIIDLQNNLKTIYLRTIQDAKVHVFNKHSFKKYMFVNFKINLLRDEKPITERYKETINRYASKEDLDTITQPELFTDPASERSIENMLESLGLTNKNKLICIPAVSGHFTKTYPAECYAEIINNFPDGNAVFFLTGRGMDSLNIQSIRSLTQNKKVYDLCDRLEIEDLISLVRRCSLVICGDTGPMHIAEAFNIPIVMMAGSSVKEFGFYPQNRKAIVLENNSLKCRPCSHYGKEKCPKGHFKCMKEITPELVLTKISSLI